MSKFYTRVLSKTMAEIMESHLGLPAAEQVSLLEELSLSRQMQAEAIAMYAAVEAMPEGEKRTALMPQVAGLMMEALKFVQSMSESAARILNTGKDKLAFENLSTIQQQLLRAAHTTWGNDDPKIKEFNEQLRKILVPVDVAGTHLTPDQDAMDMDSTIPRKPE